jgi:hypothetical protein
LAGPVFLSPICDPSSFFISIQGAIQNNYLDTGISILFCQSIST